MEKFDFSGVVTLLVLILTVGGFYVENWWIFAAGIIVLLLYLASYVNENVFVKIKELSKDINTQKQINKLREEMAFMKGVVFAKNKRGALDPISLLIVLIILIMVLQWLKQQGVI